MIPIISNVFALFSQLATRKFEYTDTSIDKRKIIADQTRIVKLNLKKAEIEKTKRVSETKVHDKVEKDLEKKGLFKKKVVAKKPKEQPKKATKIKKK